MDVKMRQRQNTITVTVGKQKAKFGFQSNNSPSFQHVTHVENNDALVYLAAFMHYPGSFELVIAVFTDHAVHKYSSHVHTFIGKDTTVTLCENKLPQGFDLVLATKHGNYVLSFEANRLVGIKASLEVDFYNE